MIKLDILRTQHSHALAMAEHLIDLADRYDPRSAAIPLLMQLNRLLGLVRIHLAHEDVQLYPALAASPNPVVAGTARRFADEMGGLAIELECFAARWSCSATIAGDIDEFRESARQLVLALAVRIEREEQQLYPLVDGAAASDEQRDAA